MSLAFVFSITSLFPADAAADRFVMKSTVTSGQREGPAFFSSFVVSVGAAADRFFWGIYIMTAS